MGRASPRHRRGGPQRRIHPEGVFLQVVEAVATGVGGWGCHGVGRQAEVPHLPGVGKTVVGITGEVVAAGVEHGDLPRRGKCLVNSANHGRGILIDRTRRDPTCGTHAGERPACHAPRETVGGQRGCGLVVVHDRSAELDGVSLIDRQQRGAALDRQAHGIVELPDKTRARGVSGGTAGQARSSRCVRMIVGAAGRLAGAIERGRI